MPSLILLNGPPGIGKSTLSAIYADRHPGTLNLDIDRLHELVGGWQVPDGRTHDVLRPVALAMASAHLAGGRDVIVPQFLGRADEIEAFVAVGLEHGADVREIVLLDDKEAAVARFADRPDTTAWDRHNRQVVEAMGGAAALDRFHDQLLELLPHRPDAVVVRSGSGAIEPTYAAVCAALVGATQLEAGTGAPQPFEVHPSGALFHGTKAELAVGDLLVPGRTSNFNLEKIMNHVYVTATLDAATWGAELAVGEGRGHIYLVRPSGELEDDPNVTDQKFPGNPTRSYRSREPVRVVGELLDWVGHSPEQVQAMRDGLADLRRTGRDVILD